MEEAIRGERIMHAVYRSLFSLIFFVIFGFFLKAFRQMQKGDRSGYGWLANVIADRKPIRFWIAGAIFSLLVLGFYLVASST
jgi:hypothetical protein